MRFYLVVFLLILGLLIFHSSDCSAQELKKTIDIHKGPFSVFSYSPDGKYLASGGVLRTELVIWDLLREKSIATFKGNQGFVNTIAFSPNGKLFAWSDDFGNITLWDVMAGKVKSKIKYLGSPIPCFAFSPDGQHLAYAEMAEIQLWELSTGKVRATFKGHSEYIRTLGFRADNKTLVSFGSPQGVTKIWDVQSFKEIATIEGPKSLDFLAIMRGPKLSPNSNLMAFAQKNNIVVWDIETKKIKTTIPGSLPDTPDYSTTYCVAFSLDSNSLAWGQYETIKLWNLVDGNEKASLENKSKPQLSYITGVAFSPDGKTIVSGSLREKNIKLWDISKLK